MVLVLLNFFTSYHKSNGTVFFDLQQSNRTINITKENIFISFFVQKKEEEEENIQKKFIEINKKSFAISFWNTHKSLRCQTQNRSWNKYITSSCKKKKPELESIAISFRSHNLKTKKTRKQSYQFVPVQAGYRQTKFR